MPLQHSPRENGNSVFLDDQLRAYNNQWAFLSSIKRLAPEDVQAFLRRMYPAGDVLNIKLSASDYDEASDPWLLPPTGRLAARNLTEGPFSEVIARYRKERGE